MAFFIRSNKKVYILGLSFSEIYDMNSADESMHCELRIGLGKAGWWIQIFWEKSRAPVEIGGDTVNPSFLLKCDYNLWK